MAEPHEFLIQLRSGVVKASGQGASCFKWPRDSVALIPMSIAKLSFSADQVTQEKVGVEVTGLAVYRVVEPMIAYRMIDGNVAELANILRDMFVGATRRIVANLSLEACLTHRKESVARALFQEIAPVLAGEGALGDTTDKGWGVVLDTIEIQNVRVLSDEVFGRLQAPFREKLALEALRAREQVAEEQAKIAIARLRTEEQARREMMALEEDRLTRERSREAEAQAHKDQLAQLALAAEIERAAKREQAEHERRTRELAGERERALSEMEVRRAQGELEAELVRTTHLAKGELSDRQLEELLLSRTLPQMAEAFRGTFGSVQLTQSSGSTADLFAFLSAGISQVARATADARAEIAGKPRAT